MTSDESAERSPLADHIEETFRAVAALRAHHDKRTSAPHRMAEAITRQMTRPLFVSALAVLVGRWILLNAGLRAAGLTAFDPPPFAWLNDAVSLLSLFVVIVVLSTQRRDEELAHLHQQLTLQLALLGEQKTA